MAKTYKILGQTAPGATTDTTLYTCPAATQTVISSITVCNRGTAAATYRIAARPNGTVLSNQHYVVFDAAIPANSTDTLTIGMTIAAADVITVYASSANFSFSAFGSEISA